MNDHALPNSPRLADLLIDRALFGLSATDDRELLELQSKESAFDNECFDRLAAQIELARTDAHGEPLPPGLRGKIAAAASQYHQAPRDTTHPLQPRLFVASDDALPADRSVLPAGRLTTATRRTMAGKWGWLAAAACLLLAVGVWWSNQLPAAPTLLAERQLLMDTAGDLVRAGWTTTGDPAAVAASGDVVWSNERQMGFMRFDGLAVNDTDRHQYQLWIFDETQDERYPIDGGVFDIHRATGDVIVPIRAKLRVQRPTMFAITVEKFGGVVVSDRSRLPLLAKLATAE